jgi:hypothetical protein
MVNELTLSVFGEESLKKQYSLSKILSILNDFNLINIGELAERAVANKAKTTQVSRCNQGFDLANGWEIKHGQTNPQKNSNQRRAYISGFKNKTADLRTIITEKLTGKLYFFKIPYSSYSKVQAESLAVQFFSDGRPSRTRRHSSCYNVWDYEIKSFEALCKKVVGK